MIAVYNKKKFYLWHTQNIETCFYMYTSVVFPTKFFTKMSGEETEPHKEHRHLMFSSECNKVDAANETKVK